MPWFHYADNKCIDCLTTASTRTGFSAALQSQPVKLSLARSLQDDWKQKMWTEDDTQQQLQQLDDALRKWRDEQIATGKTEEDMRNETLATAFAMIHGVKGKFYHYVVSTTQLGYKPQDINKFAREYLHREQGITPENLQRKGYSLLVDILEGPADEAFIIILIHRPYEE